MFSFKFNRRQIKQTIFMVRNVTGVLKGFNTNLVNTWPTDILQRTMGVLPELTYFRRSQRLLSVHQRELPLWHRGPHKSK